jgi:hypothetical protein
VTRRLIPVLAALAALLTCAPAEAATLASRGVNTCALKAGGTAACWGHNGGQLTPPGGSFTQISTGYAHACALKTNGDPVCWGEDSEGQSSPPGGAVTEISAGGAFTCAIATGGTPACWGYNASGQTTIPGGTGTVTRIEAGYAHACAIKTDGTPVCWGYGATGATTIPGGTGTVTQLSGGYVHTCAIETDGTPVCWGDDSYGESTIPGGTGTVTQIAAGTYFTCAIRTDGTPTCWGQNADGQTSIPAGIGTVTEIASGDYHACALKTDGYVACWGGNSFAQLPAGQLSGATPPLAGAGAFTFDTVAIASSPAATYSIASGSLPSGLGLDATTGQVSGAALQEGSFPVTITADDGITAPKTASFTFSFDLTAPAVSDTVDAYWHETPVEVTLIASDQRSGVAHIYYATGASPGTPATEYDPAHKPVLGNGERIRYFAVDAAGNASAPVTSAPAKVDGTAPATPALRAFTLTGRSAHIEFGGEPDATFTCILGAGEPYACSSPVDLSDLPYGSQLLVVLQRDLAGHYSPQPLAVSLSIAFPPPPIPPLPPLLAPSALAGASGGKAFVLVACPVACRATAAATVSVGAKKLGTLSGKVQLAAGLTGRIQLKPSAALKRKLRGRKATVKVTTTIVGAAGRVTKTATLKTKL